MHSISTQFWLPVSEGQSISRGKDRLRRLAVHSGLPAGYESRAVDAPFWAVTGAGRVKARVPDSAGMVMLRDLLAVGVHAPPTEDGRLPDALYVLGMGGQTWYRLRRKEHISNYLADLQALLDADEMLFDLYETLEALLP